MKFYTIKQIKQIIAANNDTDTDMDANTNWTQLVCHVCSKNYSIPYH